MIPLLEVGLKLIDKLIPDPKAKAEAQVEMLKLQQNGEFKELEERMSAIKTEAASVDPWTSRARPSFMYVMYIMILSCLPVGLMFIKYPVETRVFIEGMKLWLESIPQEMWYLFGAGYLGYTHYRTKEKLDK
jgi:Holin of 3TMs, for gene-transfer release